jgi:hypothetical protein
VAHSGYVSVVHYCELDSVKEVKFVLDKETNVLYFLANGLSAPLRLFSIVNISRKVLNSEILCHSFIVLKLPDHPARTGQARRGFPGRKYRSNCAPWPRLSRPWRDGALASHKGG